MPSIFPQLLVFYLIAPFIIRLALGTILIVHGYPKLFKDFSGTAGFFGQLGFKPAKFWALAVGVLEFFGGIALIFGFLTQAIALLVAIQFLVIILWVKRAQNFVSGWEYDFAILAMALALVFLGAGAFAVDLPL